MKNGKTVIESERATPEFQDFGDDAFLLKTFR